MGVGSEVVEEFEHVNVSFFCGRGLLLGEIAEGYQEFVVDCSGVVLDGANELLDAQFASVVERRTLGCVGEILDIIAVDDWSVAFRGMDGFLGVGVVELRSKFSDVFIH